MTSRHTSIVRVAALCLAAGIALSVSGCFPGNGKFVKILGAHANVANVDSSGGGLSDSEWEIVVYPEAGLSDTEVSELADSLATDYVEWDGVRPRELVLRVERVDISVVAGDSDVVDRVTRWIELRDDTRIISGLVGDMAQLRTESVDIIGVALDHAALEGGIEVGDFDTSEHFYTATSSVIISPDCADAVGILGAVSPVIWPEDGASDVHSAYVKPCEYAQISVSSKVGVLRTLDDLSESLAGFEGVTDFSVSTDGVDEATGRSLQWSVSVRQYTPEVAVLIAALFADPAVDEVMLKGDGTLFVAVPDVDNVNAVETLIADSGVTFTEVYVRDNL